MNEEEIILKAKDGDVSAFEMIVEQYKDYVYRIAFSVINDHHLAEDISQESFIKVYRSLNRFDSRSSFSTWLYRITYNTALDEIRKRKKDQVCSLDEMSDHEFSDGVQSTETEVIKKEELIKLEEALKSLPDKQRILIELFYRREMSLSEISEITGMNIGTIKSSMNRAKEKIKKYLES